MTPVIADMDFQKLSFSAPYSKQNKTKIDLKYNGDVPKFNLCRFRDQMLRCKWPLDQPNAEGDNSRRGQAIALPDAGPGGAENELVAVLRSFDAFIIDHATANSEAIFGKKLDRLAVEARYEYIVKENPKYPGPYIKTKVKTADGPVPTRIWKPTSSEDEEPEALDISVLEGSACEVAPILSFPSLWFMGGKSKFGLVSQIEDLIASEGRKRNAMSAFPPTSAEAQQGGPSAYTPYKEAVPEDGPEESAAAEE